MALQLLLNKQVQLVSKLMAKLVAILVAILEQFIIQVSRPILMANFEL